MPARSTQIRLGRDLIGGVIIVLFGLVSLGEGYRLGTGTLAEMGPGYMPMMFGALLVVFGVLMSRGGERGEEQPPTPDRPALHRPEWRGWLCIVGGVLAFIVLGPRAGMMPSTLACVFIAALGDREATLKGSALLAIGVAAFGAVLFHYLLQMNIPLFGASI